MSQNTNKNKLPHKEQEKIRSYPIALMLFGCAFWVGYIMSALNWHHYWKEIFTLIDYIVAGGIIMLFWASGILAMAYLEVKNRYINWVVGVIWGMFLLYYLWYQIVGQWFSLPWSVAKTILVFGFWPLLVWLVAFGYWLVERLTTTKPATTKARANS